MRARLLSRSWLTLGAALLGGGCSEFVALGSQCPESDDSCIVVDDAGGQSPSAPDAASPNLVVDAKTPAPIPDGGSPSAADTGSMSSIVFPVIGNPGFELVSGAPGDVTTLSQTDIAPWYTCQPIGGGNNPTTAVRAESSVVLTSNESPAGATVTSPDGSGTFISMQYLVNIVPIPLAQVLATPLEPGVRYAFELSVQSTNPTALLSLQLRGTGSDDDCFNLGQNDVLVETSPITTEGWQTLCLPFTSSAEHTHLVVTLRSAAPLSSAFSGARLFFDHIRPINATDCPGLAQ